ncbi:deoxyribonuclease-2-alpha-like isoform X2 [Crassostrea virginica]
MSFEFILYKVPKKGDINTNGVEFFYMDEGANSWQYKMADIRTATDNPLYETLQPVYSKSPNIESYAMYNDQPPVGNAPVKFAHSKGALAFDRTSGFWIVSSVPRFPAPVKDGYKYKDEQTKYGQTILCVSVDKSMEAKIKSVFETTEPYIYDSKNFSPTTGNKQTTSDVDMKTRGNVQLKCIAKSADYQHDIYQAIISPKIGDSLFVETWRPNLKDDNMVTNVPSVCFSNGITFYSGVDHSKWAVAKKLTWTCIGDINREARQFKRGGLSLCLNDKDVAEEFRSIVNDGTCSKRSPPPGSCPNPSRKRAKITP